MLPLISIGITCYNASDTIENAVRSALDQTWPNSEIIIVDDNSHDFSQEVLEQLAADHSNIKVLFQQDNCGVATARNLIIDAAVGEFLVFFDDDDESSAHRINEQYQRIISYENDFGIIDPVICHTARVQKYPDGTEHYEPTMGMNQGIVPNGELVALRTLIGRPIPNVLGSTATCSQMARLSVYRNLNAFDVLLRRSEDTDFNIRAALSGAHFVGLSEPLVVQNMTKALEKTLDNERHYSLKLIEKHREFIGKYTSAQFCHNWLLAKHDFLRTEYLKFSLKIIILFVTSPIFTLQRIKWALPSINTNLKLKSFHNDQK